MIANIQALRAIAALLVVFVHCDLLAAPLGVPAPVREAFACGVDIFFTISGFIMTHQAARRRSRPSAFLRNRIARVVPIYWLLTIATFLVATIAPALMGGTVASGAALAKSLLFIPFARGDGLVRPILFVGWSLNYEMLFYLLFALGLTIRPPSLGPGAVAGAIVALVIAGTAVPAHAVALHVFTRPIMLEFVLGMLLGVAYPRLPASASWGRCAAAFVPLGLVALIAANASGVGLAAVAPLCAALVGAALIAERGGLRAGGPLLVLLGDASYSLYLTHPFVTQASEHVARRLGLLSAATSVPLLLLVYLHACALAILTYRHVEGPLGRRARALLGVSPQVPPARGL